MAEPLGVILAGGQSRRMGGGDKCLTEIAGRSLLKRVIERLGPQVAGLALNANGDPGRFAAFGLPVLADPVPGFPGPLAGVLAGLDWAAARGARELVSVAADTPFLPAGLVLGLHVAAHVGGAALAYAETPDGAGGFRPHPVFAL
ncbi:MAG TPA: molybdenum cofactor guanylyltransferase, partial [Paracoccaceae bacterium]|nr:molybdenum cofactor guanylyltransferase [Paracoccaceae bacterium]